MADTSTFNYTVSNAPGSEVPVQIREAETFLASHHRELTGLLSNGAVEGAVLDFGWEVPVSAIGQFNRFPTGLLGLCARIGLDLDLSLYLVESDD